MMVMNLEMEAMKINKTFELIELPPGQKVIESKWVYKIKRDQNGKPIKYQARLVAQGFDQKEGVDYQETFSPVASIKTIRSVLAIANAQKMYIHCMDFATAYLNGDILEVIFMKQPKGFEDGTNKVIKVLKALYGLKQSGRQWNNKLHTYLTKRRFKQALSDSCLYTI